MDNNSFNLVIYHLEKVRELCTPSSNSPQSSQAPAPLSSESVQSLMVRTSAETPYVARAHNDLVVLVARLMERQRENHLLIQNLQSELARLH